MIYRNIVNTVFNYGDSFKGLAKELEKEFIKYGMIKEDKIFEERDDE